MEKIEFSVIIATYRRNKKLSRAIESVLKQLYKNFELIIIDDNGEGTEYQKKTEIEVNKYLIDSRIKYYVQKYNQGANAARNFGIEKARGDFILFLDDDDEFTKDKLLEFKKIIETQKNVGLIYSGAKYINEKTQYKYKEIKNPKLEILKGNYIGSNSFVGIKKSYLVEQQGFNSKLKSCQDWEMWIRLIYSNIKIVGINKPLVNYYIDIDEKNRISNNLEKIISGHLYVLNETLNKYLEFFNEKEKKEIIFIQKERLMRFYYKNSDFNKYRVIFKELHQMKNFSLGKILKYYLSYLNIKLK